MLRAEASDVASTSEDIAEVERYVAATRRGLELIPTLPITQRMVRDVHAVLLSDGRGADNLPGEFRRTPAWIGSTTHSPDIATFVPPLPELIGDLFYDWEKFINEPSSLPALIRCGLMHYQFETIHPFLDGNGRIGRLLVGLLLIQEKRLATPLLYLSGYLEAHRRDYYDRLQAVRERSEIQQWLQFFRTAVKRQSEDAVDRASRLVELRERYTSETTKARSRIRELIELLVHHPFVTVSRVERALKMTNQGARNLIRDAEHRGWLQDLGASGRSGKNYRVAQEIWNITDAAANHQTRSG